MLNKNYKKKNTLLAFLFMVLCILVLNFIGNTNINFAQDLSEADQQAVIMQYTLEYRFSSDLKVGDWVKYNEITETGVGAEAIELNVTGEENGNLWIEEKFHGTEIHYLVDLKRMKLIKATGTDNSGNKFDITPLSDEKVAEIIGMFKVRMEQQGSYAQFISWKKGEKNEEIVIPAGSFSCVYIRPEYSEQYAKQIKDYEKMLREQGKSDTEIDAVVFENEPRLYFNNDVPKLLPMQIAIGWMPFIDIFNEVTGGLVECRHMSPMRLTGYSGQ